MNYAVIISGVVLVILLYYLWFYFSTSVKTLVSSVNLKNNQLVFADDKLKTPSAVHYAYGFWIFINNWTSDGEPVGTLAYRIATSGSTVGANTTPTLPGPYIQSAPIAILQRMDHSQMMIYLDSNQPSLYYAVNDGSTQAGVEQRQLITNNFPIQSWTHLIFSVDNNIVDIYMNGKLVLSNVYGQGLAIPSASAKAGSGQELVLGNARVSFDANISQLQQWSNMAVDPQTAWKTYMQGNGQSMKLSNYNVALELTKDNVVQSQLSVF
jgi:hypothetical protein